MLGFKKAYDYYFKELSDPRLQDWPLMADPMPLLGILALYFYAIYFYIPKHMENRKPFNLRPLLGVYNILQVFACIALFYGMVTSGWTTYYSWSCQLPDYSQSPVAIRMLKMCWYGTVLKAVELLETVFFALRKKRNQVSALHVYHHVSTLVIAWVVTKYYGGGGFTFAALVNCIIHILMYTYYFFSLFGDRFRTTLLRWKPWMTKAQLIQLGIFLMYFLNVIRVGCKVPNIMYIILIPDNLALIAFFSNFYKANYYRKESDKKEAIKAH